MVVAVEAPVQLPLLHIVESDDIYFEEQANVLWFRVLRDLDWRAFIGVAAQYYEALWTFNQAQRDARVERARTQPEANPETRQEADRRLLFDRATLDATAPVLHEMAPAERELHHVDPSALRPGRVPLRFAGRTPKCFFAMFKAFMGLCLLGRSPEPEFVHQELVNNPSFARACGFTLSDPVLGYRKSDVPSRRKIEQFDQLMAENGLWDLAAVTQVRANFENGVLEPEPTLVHDTTHYDAHSSWRVVEGAEEDGAEDAKKTRKSQSKATKRCRCKDWTQCPHEWVLADEGAGTVVKQRGKMVWAHKASTLSFAGQEVLLDAVAMNDAASHDSRSLVPHLDRFFDRHPDLEDGVTRVLDDGALDDAGIKAQVLDDFGAELYASPNSRARKPSHKDLPRGMDHFTSLGVPVCREGFPFDFLGCRHIDERFLFRAPDDEQGTPVCTGCSRAADCLRVGSERRHVTVPFERLPFLDPDLPYLSRRFKNAMARRTVIERLHKLMKFDYGDARLTKRGNAAFQARLDKTLLAMHLVLASP
ncbi:MAG: hypothetical protein ACE5F1_19775 [Planctomycetota bacterium]